MKYLNTEISIHDLVDNFRMSLKAIAPNLDRVAIQFSDSKGAYDNWDDITENLFYYLVNEIINYHYSDSNWDDIIFPRYESVFTDYSNKSFIICIPRAAKKDTIYAFFRFNRDNRKFDKVICNELDDQYQVIEEKVFSWNDVICQLSLKRGNAPRELVSSIIIR